jgi:hypothetical protein
VRVCVSQQQQQRDPRHAKGRRDARAAPHSVMLALRRQLKMVPWLPEPVARFISCGPSNTAGLGIILAIASAAAAAEAHRDAAFTPMVSVNGSLDTFGAMAATRSDKLAGLLRAWWVDPAIASLGFATALAFWDHRERSEGCGVRESWGNSHISLLIYWLFIFGWVNLVPPPPNIPDGCPTDLPSAAYLVLEIAVGIWAYDFLFFFVHWAMHAAHFRMHHTHHRHHAMPSDKACDVMSWRLRARDVLVHSPVDGALQVITNILVQRSLPWGATKSRLARAAHNVMVTWMLAEAHTAAASPRLARRVCVGVQRHRLHHDESEPFYQQFFGYLDDARLALLRGAVTR